MNADKMNLIVRASLGRPETQRITEFAYVGPVQLASVESFAHHVAALVLEEAAKRADSRGHHWSGAPSNAFFSLAEELRTIAEGLKP